MLSLAVTSSLLFSDDKRFLIFLDPKSFNIVLSRVVCSYIYPELRINQCESISASIHQIYVIHSNVVFWFESFDYSPWVEILDSDEMQYVSLELRSLQPCGIVHVAVI